MGYNPYIAEIEETHRRQEKREARRREDEREKFTQECLEGSLGLGSIRKGKVMNWIGYVRKLAFREEYKSFLDTSIEAMTCLSEGKGFADTARIIQERTPDLERATKAIALCVSPFHPQGEEFLMYWMLEKYYPEQLGKYRLK